jgi:hypothetical protein
MLWGTHWGNIGTAFLQRILKQTKGTRIMNFSVPSFPLPFSILFLNALFQAFVGGLVVIYIVINSTLVAPQIIWGGAQTIWGARKTIWGEAQTIWGARKTIWGEAQTIWGARKTIWGGAQTIWAATKTEY